MNNIKIIFIGIKIISNFDKLLYCLKYVYYNRLIYTWIKKVFLVKNTPVDYFSSHSHISENIYIKFINLTTLLNYNIKLRNLCDY